MTSNTQKSGLSEEAQKEANLFLHSRRGHTQTGTTSSFVSRIQSLVAILGLIILVLGGTLVYLVTRPPVTQVVLPTTAPVVAEPEVVVNTIPVLTATVAISEGTQITADMLATMEIDASIVPLGAYSPYDAALVVSQYASVPIPANYPITREAVSISLNRPVPFEIPAGYRATTIIIDGRTGVEGFASPGTIVDVLWFYNDSEGRPRVVTLVPRAKVLSLGGATEHREAEAKASNQSTTATILVTQKQAHSVELARNLGLLSLSLVGRNEIPGVESADANLEVSVTDLLRRDSNPEAPYIDGAVIAVNPYTGREEKFVLGKKGWVGGRHEDAQDLVRAQTRRRIMGRLSR